MRKLVSLLMFLVVSCGCLGHTGKTEDIFIEHNTLKQEVKNQESNIPTNLVVNIVSNPKEPTILFLGLITQDSSQLFSLAVLQDILTTETTKIHLIINSRGGSVDAGLQMINIMQMAGVPFECTVKGEADSMAFVLLQRL